MDEAQAAELVQRVFSEVIDGGDYSKLPELFDEEMVEHTGMGDFYGHDGLIAMLEGFRAALPDYRHELSDIRLLDDSTLVWQTRALASFTGEMLGVSGAGQSVDLWATNAARVHDGRIVEHWGPGSETVARLMEQMGLPQPALG